MAHFKEMGQQTGWVCQPPPPLTTNTQAGVRESTTSQSNVLAPGTSKFCYDSAPLPDESQIASPEASSTKDMVKYMKVTLSILGELMGEQAVGSPIESMNLYEVGLSSPNRSLKLSAIP